MDPNKLADLLKDEYVMLQTLYEDMDSKGLTIKNWAITVALAIVGTSIWNHQKNLLWLAFAASLMFWYLEVYWRGLSHFFAVRIRSDFSIHGEARVFASACINLHSDCGTLFHVVNWSA
jgi:hypothetical protein